MVTCERCGKPGHNFKACEAGGFVKLWPGRNIYSVQVRDRDGRYYKFEGPITDEQRDEIMAILGHHVMASEGGPPR